MIFRNPRQINSPIKKSRHKIICDWKLTRIINILRNISLFKNSRCTPFGSDERIVIRLIPEIVSKVRFNVASRPRVLHLQSLRVDAEELAQSVAVEISHGGDRYLASWQAMRSVRRGYSILVHLFRFQDLAKNSITLASDKDTLPKLHISVCCCDIVALSNICILYNIAAYVICVWEISRGEFFWDTLYIHTRYLLNLGRSFVARINEIDPVRHKAR